MDDAELGSLSDIVSARRAAGEALAPLWLWVLAVIAVGLVLSALLVGVAGLRGSASVGHAVGHLVLWVFGFGIIALVLNSPQWKRHRGVIPKVEWVVPGSGMVRKDPLAQEAPAPAPDQDRLIAPRTRLILCAVLDCVDSMTIDRLAKTLNVSPPDLAHEITTLTRAGCIELQPNDSGQQWISLSAIGHSALANRENALLEAALRRK
jgi:hypothetical protein